mgnify:CR=1 FL=1
MGYLDLIPHVSASGVINDVDITNLMVVDEDKDVM